jgi:acetate kinase
MNILAINSGSSSLKASLLMANGERKNYRYIYCDKGYIHSHAKAFISLLDDLESQQPDLIAHRFVHGGEIANAARFIDANERARLQSITYLAPLHMPTNLLGVDLCAKQFNCPQIACFDTAFHATLPEKAYRLAIPQSLKLRRYGFHGINYSHIAQQLPKKLGATANGLVAVAHLGHGASLCLLENLYSVDTSMGYSTAGGIAMGTRSGDIDPGVILTLSKSLENSELNRLIYEQSGLLALSDGESSDMAALIASKSKSAQFAVEYFARQVRSTIGSFAAKAGGIDGLVFTGGIGENSKQVRALICEPLGLLGFALNNEANSANLATLNTNSSKPILIIPADEEAEMARLAKILYAEINHVSTGAESWQSHPF